MISERFCNFIHKPIFFLILETIKCISLIPVNNLKLMLLFFLHFKVQPLYDNYQREVEINLWEPINRYWAECYEACKMASKKRNTFQTENRTLFQVSRKLKKF